ncbi:hypothetical protein [Synechococcus sp. PCC 7336]|uniref:hypothetical protein n=1 Tax=Synechococcus sp. PCC 7336 TaxID=195250 RepID=UPI000348F712|nr:hypothetical protein [Synechococcus sp. PCC 7336]
MSSKRSPYCFNLSRQSAALRQLAASATVSSTSKQHCGRSRRSVLVTPQTGLGLHSSAIALGPTRDSLQSFRVTLRDL